MKILNIDNGWTIKLPENWLEEREEVENAIKYIYSVEKIN